MTRPRRLKSTLSRALHGWGRFSLWILVFSGLDLLVVGITTGLGWGATLVSYLLLWVCSLLGALVLVVVSPLDARGNAERPLLGWVLGGATTTVAWSISMLPLLGSGESPLAQLVVVSIVGGIAGLVYGMIARTLTDRAAV